MVEVFYFADRNKDGVLTVEELAVIETVDQAAFRAADKRRDGRLTVEEFVAYRMIDFDAADKNKDGVLTYDEVQTWTASTGKARMRSPGSCLADPLVTLTRLALLATPFGR